VTHGLSYFAGTPSVYLPVADAQRLLFAGRHDVTAVALRGSPTAVPRGLALMTPAATRADLLTPLRNGLRSIDVVRDFLWIVAAVIIAAVVYLSALERRRDFAVLKAIGSSNQWLFGGMALQAAFVAVLSGVLAIAAEPLLAQFVPMELAVPASARTALPPVALAIGLVASLSGLRQVLRADPALAFGGA
jgi:putative ABC transport system permease protein